MISSLKITGLIFNMMKKNCSTNRVGFYFKDVPKSSVNLSLILILQVKVKGNNNLKEKKYTTPSVP